MHGAGLFWNGSQFTDDVMPNDGFIPSQYWDYISEWEFYSRTVARDFPLWGVIIVNQNWKQDREQMSVTNAGHDQCICVALVFPAMTVLQWHHRRESTEGSIHVLELVYRFPGYDSDGQTNRLTDEGEFNTPPSSWGQGGGQSVTGNSLINCSSIYFDICSFR